MAKIGRPSRITPAQKDEIWDRWKNGETLSEIAAALSFVPGSIQRVIATNGGYAPRVQKRREGHLRIEEREEISRGLANGDSIRSIAISLNRAPSTISREINRNGGVHSYRATSADTAAWEAAKRPQAPKLALNDSLREVVAEKLKEDWSPEQISGWLQLNYSDPDMRISVETIYKSLFVQARNVLDKALTSHLRTRRGYRKNRNGAGKYQGQGQIVDAIPIKDRPSKINDRSEYGHWEGDLIIGSRNSAIATIVERKYRQTTLVRVNGKDSPTVVTALSYHLRTNNLPPLKSITWDRGTELAAHKRLTSETGISIYFADAKSPWQRGTNENTNKLLRQYLPKGTNLSAHTQLELDKIAEKLNNRPRKILGYLTPNEAALRAVALTD